MKANLSLLAFAVAAVLLTTAACSKDPEVAKREYVRSGDTYVANKQYREAIVEYRNAVQQDPRFGEARSKLAEAYFQIGDIENAFREYVRAADLLPNDVRAQLKAGDMLLAAKRYEDESPGRQSHRDRSRTCRSADSQGQCVGRSQQHR